MQPDGLNNVFHFIETARASSFPALFVPLFSNEQSRELNGFHTEEGLCPKRL